QMAVLRQRMVFREPGVFPAGSVCHLDELSLLKEGFVFLVPIVGALTRDVALQEQAELHRWLRSTLLERVLVLAQAPQRCPLGDASDQAAGRRAHRIGQAMPDEPIP